VLGRIQRELRTHLEEIRAEIAILSNDYTENRRYLDDCLGLTANPKALYEQSNPDTRRLANQVFFNKLFIDETSVGTPPKAHHQIRAELDYPFDELTNPTVAQEAQKMVEAGLTNPNDTPADPGSVVACLNLGHLGSLSGHFYNITPRLKTLVGRWLGGMHGWRHRAYVDPIADVRGEFQNPLGRTQTFLDAALVDSLKAHHENGRSCASLAREHSLHKMTVIRTLREAGVETRRPPLRESTDLASRVRGLHEDGLSERRIAVAVGVSRSSVHRLLAMPR